MVGEEKHVHHDREGRTSSTNMGIAVVAHDVVGVVEEAVEPAKKSTNNSEQSRRDASQKPYRPSPGAGSQRTGFRRPALPDGCARSRRDGKTRE